MKEKSYNVIINLFFIPKSEIYSNKLSFFFHYQTIIKALFFLSPFIILYIFFIYKKKNIITYKFFPSLKF